MEKISVKIDEDGNVQREEIGRSVEEILRPTTLVCWILGVGVPRPLTCPKIATIFLRLVHFAICTVIVAYGAIDFFTFGSIFKSDTFMIIYYINKVASYLSSYYYVYHGIYHYRKWPELMERIGIIDKKMQHLSLNHGDRSFNIFQLLTLMMTLVIGPLSLISHVIYYYYTRPEDIYASDLLLYYTMAQSLTVNFSFDLIVFAIYRRFKAVNRAILSIDEGFTSAMIILEIRRARELHHAVSELVRFVNGIHGIHLLLSSVNSLTTVVATLFVIYMGIVENKYGFMMIDNVIWITYAAQFALTCGVCTKACRESSKTSILAHDIVLSRVRNCDLYAVDVTRISNDSKISLRREIHDFVAQLRQCNVDFTACEFFSMNNALLASFIGVITTYLIILVQFYQPEVHEMEDTFTTLRSEDIEF